MHFTNRIQELIDATQPYAPGLNKTFVLDNKSGKLKGTFYIKEDRTREELETLLEGFTDVLGAHWIYPKMPLNIVEDCIAQCRFGDIEKAAVKDIERTLVEIRKLQGEDLAYSLSLCLDPDQGGWTYAVGCEEAFRRELEKKLSEDHGDLYIGDKNLERFRYYEDSSFVLYPGEELGQLLHENSERSIRNYERYGERYLKAEGSHLFELTIDAAARALNLSKKMAAGKLAISECFSMYIQCYGTDNLTHFRIARKSMSLEEIRSRMGNLYADILSAM